MKENPLEQPTTITMKMVYIYWTPVNIKLSSDAIRQVKYKIVVAEKQ